MCIIKLSLEKSWKMKELWFSRLENSGKIYKWGYVVREKSFEIDRILVLILMGGN